jgi:hypothetical protein
MQCSFGEFFEDINDALKEAVRALGGTKAVGALLWPELAPDTAGNRMRDCLNPDRREKLSPEQFLFILRGAREAGCHSAMGYVAAECGYAQPKPVERDEQLNTVQEQFINSVQDLQKLAGLVERLSRPSTPLKQVG